MGPSWLFALLTYDILKLKWVGYFLKSFKLNVNLKIKGKSCSSHLISKRISSLAVSVSYWITAEWSVWKNGDCFRWTRIKFVHSHLRYGWQLGLPQRSSEQTARWCFPAVLTTHETSPPVGPGRVCPATINAEMYAIAHGHGTGVIYHAFQYLWIDWNKINVVQGLTANIYRVVSAALL